MKIRATDGSTGFTEYHAIGCKHNNVGFCHEIEIDAANLNDLCHQLELDVNDDFAADAGMTVEDFVAEGMGYQVSTAKDSTFRVFPCIKF